MRFFILFVLVLLLGCHSSSNEMQLTGEVSGLRKGMLLLQKIEDTLWVSVDSIRVDGKAVFHFNTEIESPEVYYLTMRFDDSIQNEKRIPFFAEASHITLNSKLKNYEIESKVLGSVNQEKWETYKLLMKRYNDKNLELIEKHFNAMKEGQDSLATAYEAQRNKLIASRYLATVNFAKNQSDYEIAPYLMLTEVYDANIKYHDTIYKLLTPKIKDSKYGKALESFIKAYK